MWWLQEVDSKTEVSNISYVNINLLKPSDYIPPGLTFIFLHGAHIVFMCFV
jgi:hypothetical protein